MDRRLQHYRPRGTDGRVRQAEPVGGRLLRPGDEDGGHDQHLAIGGAGSGGTAAARHALASPAAASHSSRPSIGIS